MMLTASTKSRTFKQSTPKPNAQRLSVGSSVKGVDKRPEQFNLHNIKKEM